MGQRVKRWMGRWMELCIDGALYRWSDGSLDFGGVKVPLRVRAKVRVRLKGAVGKTICRTERGADGTDGCTKYRMWAKGDQERMTLGKEYGPRLYSRSPSAHNSMFARLGTDYEIRNQSFFAISEAMTTD